MADFSKIAQENEKQVIATLLKDPSSRGEIISTINNPSHYFKVDECQKLFSAMRKIHNDGYEIHAETLHMSSVIPIEVIKNIHDNYEPVPATNRKLHLEELKKNAMEYDLKTGVYSDITSVLLDGSKSYETKIQYIKEKSEELITRKNEGDVGLKPISTIIDEYKLVLADRAKGTSFYPTGDRRLDELMTYGFAPQELTSIAGRPSNGKSLMAEDYARRSANMGINTAIVNLEMKNTSVVDRLVCMGAQLDPTLLIKCFEQMTDTDKGKMNVELDRMKEGMSLMMYDKPLLDIDGLVSLVSQAQERVRKEYMIVYVDLATKLTDFSRANTVLDYQRCCDRIQNITKKLGVHMVVLLQVNRSSDKEKLTGINDAYKIYPTFSQIKNSGAFEEVSDNILMVSKPSNYLNRYEWGEFVPSYLRIELAKQRGGSPSGVEDVLLYKLNNNYLGLINPEKDWDPLKISLDQNDISAYLRKA